jgi:phosphoglycolate phosphatase-like HAD superfamily hydrolase
MDVVLFDIDGTLVDSGGAGRRAIERAAEQLHSRLDLFDGIHFDGATDRAICRAALQRLERRFGEEEIDRLLERYVSFLGEEIAESSRYLIHRGAEELIARLCAAGVLLGLGTGNVEPGARIKLERGGTSQLRRSATARESSAPKPRAACIDASGVVARRSSHTGPS